MKRTVLMVCVMVLAGALQSQISDRVIICGSAPDFLVAATIAMALVVDPALGAILGFAAGLIHASIVGISFGGFLVSRTLLGFGVGCLREWVFQDNPLVLLAAALLGTFACEGMFFLIDPTRSTGPAFAQLPTESVYNALWAVVCYLLVRRTMENERQPQPSGF